MSEVNVLKHLVFAVCVLALAAIGDAGCARVTDDRASNPPTPAASPEMQRGGAGGDASGGTSGGGATGGGAGGAGSGGGTQ